ncbi:unnamed protein product [Caenorhabditis sp. 36 PRJEB53466]|nr:unnamed protein product [Caenorhabditis sp. 36 PRJEB53466]
MERHFGINCRVSLNRSSEEIDVNIVMDNPEPWKIVLQFTPCVLKDDGTYHVFAFSTVCFHPHEQGERELRRFDTYSSFSRNGPFTASGTLTVCIAVEILYIVKMDRIRLRTFDDPNVGDFKIVVGTKKKCFLLPKMFLAMQCAYFKGMFEASWNETEEMSVVFEKYDEDAFHEFMEVLIGEPVVNDVNVTHILNFGDYFGADTAVRSCQKFLVENSESVGLQECLRLALRFPNLTDLMNKCMDDLKVSRLLPRRFVSNNPQMTAAEFYQHILRYQRQRRGGRH